MINNSTDYCFDIKYLYKMFLKDKISLFIGDDGNKRYRFNIMGFEVPLSIYYNHIWANILTCYGMFNGK